MKAIISITYSDTYLYFLPIVTYCWNKLGVDVICFMPEIRDGGDREFKEMGKLTWQKVRLISEVNAKNGFKITAYYFNAPEHKESTYAQCSRLYAACLDLPEDEVIFTSDVDMALFKLPPYVGGFTIFGADLVPAKQYPMCYISAKVKDWRRAFELYEYKTSTEFPKGVSGGVIKSYQNCLDELLGGIEAQHFRGNYWGKDQETAYNKISLTQEINITPRAKPGTQFASKRYDRDDAYILHRLSPDMIDFHMNRPGYEDRNFEIILTILKYHYPSDSFDWLIDYNNAYKKLL